MSHPDRKKRTVPLKDLEEKVGDLLARGQENDVERLLLAVKDIDPKTYSEFIEKHGK